jgi:mannose-1-phosphate guanylyltransferase
MILCAGLGTRLRPLSSWRAKPLVPIGDRPALAHILDRVRAGGAERIVVNAHHRVGDLRAFLPGDVVLSEETTLLGTAGGVARGLAMLDASRDRAGAPGDVLVWNGDILAEVDVRGLWSAHAHAVRDAREKIGATLVVSAREAPFVGNAGIDEGGRVVRLRKETVRAGEVRSADFLGIHVLGASLCDSLPAEGDLVGDVYLPAMRRGASLAVFDYDARANAWWDIGTLASYRAANFAWLGARGVRSFVGAGARVGAIAIEASIVGDGAIVEGTGTLARCIVWPGAHVTAPLTDAIVSGEGVVVSA